MRLVVLTCVYLRCELTRIVLRRYHRLQGTLAGEIDLRLLAVGSMGGISRDICESSGFDYVEHPNEPLSHKWNHGVREARRYDPDGLVIVGSDDMISARLLRAYVARLAAGHDYFGLKDLYFYDLVSSQLGYWGGYKLSEQQRQGEPIGCGRCHSRRLLERTGWNLWPQDPPRDRELDSLSLAYLREFGFAPDAWRMAQLDAHAVDIKSGFNLNRFSDIPFERVQSGSAAHAYLSDLFSSQEVAQLLALSHQGGEEAGATAGSSSAPPAPAR
jgi:hypothetical protein